MKFLIGLLAVLGAGWLCAWAFGLNEWRFVAAFAALFVAYQLGSFTGFARGQLEARADGGPLAVLSQIEDLRLDQLVVTHDSDGDVIVQVIRKVESPTPAEMS